MHVVVVMPDTTDVIDEPASHRFRYSEDGIDAQLIYRADADRLILIHTEVPDALGGEASPADWFAPRPTGPGRRARPSCRGAPMPASGCATTPMSPPPSPSTGATRPDRSGPPDTKIERPT